MSKTTEAYLKWKEQKNIERINQLKKISKKLRINSDWIVGELGEFEEALKRNY